MSDNAENFTSPAPFGSQIRSAAVEDEDQNGTVINNAENFTSPAPFGSQIRSAAVEDEDQNGTVIMLVGVIVGVALCGILLAQIVIILVRARRNEKRESTIRQKEKMQSIANAGVYSDLTEPIDNNK